MFLSIHVVFHRFPKFDKVHQIPLGYIYMSIIQTCRIHTWLLALCAEIRHVVSMGKLSKHIWVADGIRRPKPHVTTTTYWCMRNEEMGTKKPGYVLSLNLCMYASAYIYSSQIYIQKGHSEELYWWLCFGVVGAQIISLTSTVSQRDDKSCRQAAGCFILEKEDKCWSFITQYLQSKYWETMWCFVPFRPHGQRR